MVSEYGQINTCTKCHLLLFITQQPCKLQQCDGFYELVQVGSLHSRTTFPRIQLTCSTAPQISSLRTEVIGFKSLNVLHGHGFTSGALVSMQFQLCVTSVNF